MPRGGLHMMMMMMIMTSQRCPPGSVQGQYGGGHQKKTSGTLHLPNVTRDDGGVYDCVTSNPLLNVTRCSVAATLTVLGESAGVASLVYSVICFFIFICWTYARRMGDTQGMSASHQCVCTDSSCPWGRHTNKQVEGFCRFKIQHVFIFLMQLSTVE